MSSGNGLKRIRASCEDSSFILPDGSEFAPCTVTTLALEASTETIGHLPSWMVLLEVEVRDFSDGQKDLVIVIDGIDGRSWLTERGLYKLSKGGKLQRLWSMSLCLQTPMKKKLEQLGFWYCSGLPTQIDVEGTAGNLVTQANMILTLKSLADKLPYDYDFATPELAVPQPTSVSPLG